MITYSFFFTFCSSDTPVAAGDGNSEKPTSIVGSLTNLFTGGDASEEDDSEDDTTEETTPPPMFNNRKQDKSADVSENLSKPSAKTPAKRKTDDNDWFSKTETTNNLISKKKTKPKLDDWFKSSPANSFSRKVHRSEDINNKKNKANKKVETENSDSIDSSDEYTLKTDTTIVTKESNSDEDDDLQKDS